MFVPGALFQSICLFHVLAHGLPAYTLRNDDELLTETWHIPRLDMHFMGSNTGIPGNGPWPVSAQFPSSIDFDIVVPNRTFVRENRASMGFELDNITVTCGTTFLNGTLPTSDTVCTGDGLGDTEAVVFSMRPFTELGVRRPEISFTLDILRIIGPGAGEKDAGYV